MAEPEEDELFIIDEMKNQRKSKLVEAVKKEVSSRLSPVHFSVVCVCNVIQKETCTGNTDVMRRLLGVLILVSRAHTDRGCSFCASRLSHYAPDRG